MLYLVLLSGSVCFFRPVLIDSATPPLSTTTASLSPVVRKLSLTVYSLVIHENISSDQVKNLSSVVCFHGFDSFSRIEVVPWSFTGL